MDGSFKRPASAAAGQPARSREPQMGFSAVLPMRALPRFTPAELLAVLNRILGPAGASAELVPGLTRFEQSPGSARVWHRPKVPPRVGVAVAGITLVAEGQDRPAPAAGETAELEFRSWPTGPRDLERSRAHLRIFEAEPAPGSDLDLNHDRAAALTAVAEAAAELTQPAGLVWETSGVAVPRDELATALPALMSGEPPVALWVRAAVEPWGVVATRGFYALLGAEIEVRAPSLSEAGAGREAMMLVAEILGTGVPPAEGMRTAHSKSLTFSVRYRGAEEGAPPAIVLEEAAPQAPDLAAGAA